MPGFEAFNQRPPPPATEKGAPGETGEAEPPTSNRRRRPSQSSPSLDTASSASKRKGKKPNVKRDHLGAHQKLIDDFFRFDPTHHHTNPSRQDREEEQAEDARFCAQFKLSKRLFRRIHSDLIKHDLHFTQRKDALGNLGHSSYQKVLVAVRQLSHGIGKPEAILDCYIRMAESTALESLLRFCTSLGELYGGRYLRSATAAEAERASVHNQRRGFPAGLQGYLGWRAWEWTHCPTGWSGRFKAASPTTEAMAAGRKKMPPTILLEGLVDFRGWFWAAYVATPGACKDLDLFAPLPPIYAPVFAPPTLDNGRPAFFLAHPIYPARPPLCPPPSSAAGLPPPPQEVPAELRRRLQDEFDRAVDSLENRFRIIHLPCRLWSSNSMIVLIKAALILHNMIIDDQPQPDPPSPPPPPPLSTAATSDIQVHPSSSASIPAAPSTLPSHHQHPTIPPHVFAKLNYRYQLFNPSSSLIPPQ
ncbi:hypothetical protein PtB15_15B309 [Puccinia triticina]|nr:hypothetical protein PtB15_15B309 [Puccinia triticina]